MPTVTVWLFPFRMFIELTTAWLVSVKVTVLEVAKVAVMETGPGAAPKVTRVLTCPLDPEVETAFESVADPDVTAQVTWAPLTGIPQPSVTVATSGDCSVWPADPVWLLPEVMATLCAVPGVMITVPW